MDVRWSVLSLMLAGCLIDLDREPACGDGFVDEQVGEQCEPDVDDTYLAICRERFGTDRPGGCDPTTCQWDLSDCLPPCGNGMVDEGEECDPSAPLDPAFAAPGKPCDELDPPGPVLEYAGGYSTRCLDDCTFDRRQCHFCGDGSLQLDETCDGQLADVRDVDDVCYTLCVFATTDPRPARVRCDLACTDDCSLLVPVDDNDPGCCLPAGEPLHPTIECCSPPGATDLVCPLALGG